MLPLEHFESIHTVRRFIVMERGWEFRQTIETKDPTS